MRQPLASTDLAALARLHKALSDPSRLRILNLLLALGELCVCDVESALGFTQSKASRHLNILKQAGLVADRRDAIWSYYRVAEGLKPAADAALRAVREALEDDAALRAEVETARQRRRSPTCESPAATGQGEP